VTLRAQRGLFRPRWPKEGQKAIGALLTPTKLPRRPIRPHPIQIKQLQTQSRQPQTRTRLPATKSPPRELINEFVTWAASIASTPRTSGRSSHTLVCKPVQDATSLPISALRRHQYAIEQPRSAPSTRQMGEAGQQSHPDHQEQRDIPPETHGIVKGLRPIALRPPPIAPGRLPIAPEPARNVPSQRATVPWRHTIAPKRPLTAKRLRSMS
jgi:hypothetical protein